MSKMVDLNLVLTMLRDEAERVNRQAAECAGVDDGADARFQGLRNGYLQAAELIERKSVELA